MRRDVGRVQLCGDGQMLNRFFKIAAFLDEFVAKPITAEKASWVFGDHLSEGIKIHVTHLMIAARMIPLRFGREPDL